MARGYPDYFGYSIFPYYGSMTRVPASPTTVAAGNTETVFDIASKAILLGGYLDFVMSKAWSGMTLKILSDAVQIFDSPIDYMLAQANFDIDSLVAGLFRIDRVNNRGGLRFARDIPFGQTFQVKIVNSSVANITVAGYLYYTIIQS